MKSGPSFVLDSGQRVRPFSPPSQRDWNRITRRLRHLMPLPFPVRFIRSGVAPDKAETDAGGVWCWYKNGKVCRGLIWVHEALPRIAVIDGVCHEWIHLRREFKDPNPDLEKMPHDDDYWLEFGKLYRMWMMGEP